MANWNGAVASRAEIREMKRRAALRVAARIFNEKGYHATSLDEIADEIGVTKTALYYYFKNKEQLLYECIKLTYNCGQNARLEAEKADGSAFEKLQLLYRRFMENLMEERGAYTTMANIRSLPQDHQAELLDRRRALDRYSRMLIEKAIEEGDLRPVDVRITSNFFLGAVNWILRWHSEDDAMSPQDVSAHFLDLFMNGIAQRSS
ncbi:TetR/AcrR family transcriptional regulator [Pseudooceanicola sp.]|uniref:TetR/AcrR family transcriptional regulator n=1 Tax=Pseudooceanicola sp. TaxID=1914328 RepID=UPI00261226AF|nr:TetR/AcrR family transcriptional regulator [Pseudooceanicola sp.]MDF1855131.1 TetR/AcrR family transcriptional regulator [Pseudooceanicola sp.]